MNHRLITALGATLVLGQLSAGAQSVPKGMERFLKAGTRRPQAMAPQQEAHAPADQTPAQGRSPGLQSLHKALSGRGEGLFEAASALHAKAVSQLTCGPEIAALKAEEAHLRELVARHELGAGDMNARMARERQAMAASLRKIAKFYKPGSDAYKAAVVREAKRRRPRLESMEQLAARCPQAIEALKDRLAKVTIDREYLEWSAAELARPSESPWAVISSLALDGQPPANAETPGDVNKDYMEAAKWLKNQDVDLPELGAQQAASTAGRAGVRPE